MGFNWTAFGTGFAQAASEDFAKEEESARILAAANVKSMYENYASVVKENRTLSNDVKEKINVIKGFAPTATDDQLVALAQDRGILDMLSTRLKEKDFDATGFDINNFVKVTNASDSKLGAEERINQLFTIPSAVNSASAAFKSLTPEGEKESPGFLSNFSLTDLAKRGGEREGKVSAERTAAVLGVPLEKLQGAMGYKRDIRPSGAVYNLSTLKGKKGFAETKDATQLEMLEAKTLYDEDPTNPEALKKLKNATSKVASVVVIENMGKAETKETEDDIRTRLTSKIVNIKTSPEERKAAELELEQRQKLLNKDSVEAAIQTDLINKIQDPATSKAEAAKFKAQLDERQTLLAKDVSAEKITQTNYIVIASKAISFAVTEALPPGSLTSIVNPDGTMQMMPSDLVKGPRFTSAINAAKAGLTSQFTDKDGKPLSEFHKNALISVNIMPNAQGRFVAAPAAAETSTEPAPAPAAPAVVAPLVPRPAAPAAAAPAATSIRPAGVKFTPEQEAIVAKAEAAIAQGANVDATKKRLKDNEIPGF